MYLRGDDNELNIYQILQGPFECIPQSYPQRPPHLHLMWRYRQSDQHMFDSKQAES